MKPSVTYAEFQQAREQWMAAFEKIKVLPEGTTLGKFICWLARRHRWRRARKGEPADTRHCERCPATRPIRKRKAKA